jgi:Domain of unknown function (DUF4167)
LINNRQAGRRNRGRNNGRPNGNNNRGGGDNGNRIDNRARGNAPQLLEKYRNMARDAHMSGDRVNAEYYLQFADHYFRVLADNRSRQEDQQPQRFRRNDEGFDETEGAEGGFDERGNEYAEPSGANDGESYREQNQNRESGRDQNRERSNGNRYERRDRRPSEGERAPAAQAAEGASVHEAPVPVSVPQAQEEAVPATRRRGRPPRAADPAEAARTEERAEESVGLDLAALPPAISRADNDGASDEPVAPRKRGRKPRAVEAEAAE